MTATSTYTAVVSNVAVMRFRARYISSGAAMAETTAVSLSSAIP